MFTRIISVFFVLALAYAQPGNGMGMGTRGGGNKNKGVCQTLQGAGSPAFGLCNAYCNAKKCNEESVPTTSCTNLKTKFMSITGGMLPCDTSPVEPTPPTASMTSAPTMSTGGAMSDAPSATPVSVSASDAPSTAPTFVIVDGVRPTLGILTASPSSDMLP